MLNKILAMVVMLGFIGVAAGCNTMEGAGKDIERGGEKMQDSAKDTKK
jgi:entericidin B